jgi:hypothetical protein
VQAAGEAAAVRLGDAVEGVGGGGGAVGEVPDLHDGSMVAVLGADRPRGVPGGGLTSRVGSYRLLHHSEDTPTASEHKKLYNNLLPRLRTREKERRSSCCDLASCPAIFPNGRTGIAPSAGSGLREPDRSARAGGSHPVGRGSVDVTGPVPSPGPTARRARHDRHPGRPAMGAGIRPPRALAGAQPGGDERAGMQPEIRPPESGSDATDG